MSAAARRRVVRGCSTVLIVAGLLILVDACLTFTWQEPVTHFIASHTQSRLRSDLKRLAATPLSPAQQQQLSRLADDRKRVGFMAQQYSAITGDGEPIGRIVIRRIGADFVIVRGSSPGDLRKGPGLYDGSPLPGASGTVAIAGHRTTYLAPFRHVDDLREGDPIDITTPYASFTYRVTRTQIVKPTDLSVIRRVRFDQLVLTACHPLFSASKRIVIFARLGSERPAPVVAQPQLVPSVSR